MNESLFSGLRVIDCATVVAAPAAAVMLADYGADVIKIEQPGDGDILRTLSEITQTPDAEGDWFWQLDGRNKRSIVLNLKRPEGLQILHELVRGCDVFITNQPFGVRDSIGLGYEELKSLNATMIYASLSAYGEKGPERERRAFDQLAYWARSGLMELMREPGTMPTQGLPGMGDHPTAVSLYAGIVTALLHRERTGEGSLVSTSLLANGLWSASGIAQGAMAAGDMPKYRRQNRFNPAMMRPYRTQDDRWLQLNMIRSDEMMSLLLTVIEAFDLLADERFSTQVLILKNREAFSEAIQAVIQEKTSREWLEIFESHALPVNLVATIEETVDDPQILENGMALVPDDDDAKLPLVIIPPIEISGVPKIGVKRAPELGEHADEILKELGYEAEQIEALRTKGVL